MSVPSLSGRVFARFVAGTNSVVRNAEVLKGLGSGCDEAVLAAVRQLPTFNPGMQNGCPVAVSYAVPVLCKLYCGPRLPAATNRPGAQK